LHRETGASKVCGLASVLPVHRCDEMLKETGAGHPQSFFLSSLRGLQRVAVPGVVGVLGSGPRLDDNDVKHVVECSIGRRDGHVIAEDVGISR
jgi:hypothetical protein